MKINGLDKYKGEPINLDLGTDITKITHDFISAMKMSFSEKKKIEEQYLDWCEEQNKEIKGGKIDKNSFVNIITFLQSIGWDNIKALKAENADLRKDLSEAITLISESRELVSLNDNMIDLLAAENADLHERLERAVELPCRVGDKVYCIHGMSNPEMLEWQVNEIRITDHNYMLQLGRAGTKDYRNEASQFYGKWWFTELEAAEARLAELKGENNG